VNHPRPRIKTALAVALTLAACTAGPAAARPIPDPPPAVPTQSHGSTNPCSEVCGASGYGSVSQHTPTATGHGSTLPHDPPPHPVVASTVATSSGDSFDWLDAAVGAGGTIVVLLFAAGGVHIATNRRARHVGAA
jgi:hypothetical protein